MAIISSVPGGGYAAWGGTSMAAPHITGLLALIGAHHPAVANMPRGVERVDRMFQIAIDSAMSVGLDGVHGGAGIPSIAAALRRAVQPQSIPLFVTEAGLAAPVGQDVEKIVKAVS